MGSSKAGVVEEEAESILRLRPRHQHNGHAVSLADHCSALSPLCLCGSSFLHDGQRLGAHSGLQWVLRQPNLQAIESAIRQFEEILCECDQDGSGTINLEELQIHL